MLLIDISFLIWYYHGNPPKTSITAYDQVLLHLSTTDKRHARGDRGFVISFVALDPSYCTYSDNDLHAICECGKGITAHHRILQTKNHKEKYVIRRRREVGGTLQKRRKGNKKDNKDKHKENKGVMDDKILRKKGKGNEKNTERKQQDKNIMNDTTKGSQGKSKRRKIKKQKNVQNVKKSTRQAKKKRKKYNTSKLKKQKNVQNVKKSTRQAKKKRKKYNTMKKTTQTKRKRKNKRIKDKKVENKVRISSKITNKRLKEKLPKDKKKSTNSNANYERMNANTKNKQKENEDNGEEKKNNAELAQESKKRRKNKEKMEHGKKDVERKEKENKSTKRPNKKEWKKKNDTDKDKEKEEVGEKEAVRTQGGINVADQYKFPHLVSIVQFKLRKKSKKKPKGKKKVKVARICSGFIINDKFIGTTTSCCTYCRDIWNKRFRRKQSTTHSNYYSNQEKTNSKSNSTESRAEPTTTERRILEGSNNDTGEIKQVMSGSIRKVSIKKKKKNTRKKPPKDAIRKKKVHRKKKNNKYLKPQLSDIKVAIKYSTTIQVKRAHRLNFDKVANIWLPEECEEKMKQKTRNGRRLFPVECLVLLQLSESLEFGPYISPVCLPIFQTFDPNFLVGSSVSYGYRSGNSKKNFKTPNTLSGIVKLPTSVCEDKLGGLGLDETMMCTSTGSIESMCHRDKGVAFLVYTPPYYGYTGYLSAQATLAVPGCEKNPKKKPKPKTKRSGSHKIQVNNAMNKFDSKIKKEHQNMEQSGKAIKRGDKKKQEKPMKEKNTETKNRKRKRKKKKKKKRRQPKKYNMKKTTNSGIDVWVEITPYVNWIIKVVFDGNDCLVCQRPTNFPNIKK